MQKRSVLLFVLAIASGLSSGSARADSKKFENYFESNPTPVELEDYWTWGESSREFMNTLDVVSEAERLCSRVVNPQLRNLFFEIFTNYLANNPNSNVQTAIARFSKVMAMAMKESAGVPAVIADMRLNGSALSMRLYSADNRRRERGTTYRSSLSSQRTLLANKSIRFNQQTNFGLLQMSADRMMPVFLGNIIARMHPELKQLAASNPSELYDRCGASWGYHDDRSEVEREYFELTKCDPSYRSAAGVKCFGRWMMLCPTMNVSLALATTDRYFQTRNVKPVCAASFKVLARAILTKVE